MTLTETIGVVGVGVAIFFGWRYTRRRYLLAEQERLEKCSVKDFHDSRKSIKKDRKAIYGVITGGRKVGNKHIRLRKDLRLLVGQNWIPNAPFPIQSIRLSMADDLPRDIKLDTRFLPSLKGKKYQRYSDAVEDLDRPLEFQDRSQYRLLEINNDGIIFSRKAYSYFDKVDFGEYLIYQIYQSGRRGKMNPKKTDWSTVLSNMKRPSDYVVLCGVNTLTLLHDGNDLRLLMHLREITTGTSMGTFHVIPAGEFQPSCRAPSSYHDDFDLWKSIAREYSEELLLMKEYDGNSTIPFSYEKEPFLSLTKEISSSNIKPYYLGIGLDPITLQGEILTVVVFKESVFNSIFRKIITSNPEGKIITEEKRWGLPFTEKEYSSYEGANILPAGYATLKLAWTHRQFLKGCFT